jgi:hypothetical protein
VIAVLDSHVLIWAYTMPSKLSQAVRGLLDDSAQPLVIPTIALTEIEYLARRTGSSFNGRVAYGEVSQLPNCVILPYTVDILLRLPPKLTMHDAIYVASTHYVAETTGEPVRLITKDAEIHASGLVDCMWD